MEGIGTDAAPPPLRARLLGGGFFGPAHRATVAELAAFLAAPAGGLAAWFGAEQAEGLGAEARRALIDRDVAALDAMIADQLDAILHAPRLQRLEGAWRGLHWLVQQIAPATSVQVKVLNVTWAELDRDQQRAQEFDRSALFQLVYEREFGIAGGQPFGILVIDHEIRLHPSREVPVDDLELLAALAGVAAAAFAPTVLAASAALLEADDWAALGRATAPAASLSDPRWPALASKEDARFIAVALPRLLARPPWGDDPARQDGFRYREHAADAASRVWMTPGYALAAIAARAFANHGWPADIAGVEPDTAGGAVVTDLPSEDCHADPPGVWRQPPLEVIFNDRQERILAQAGLMPVTSLPYSAEVAFAAMRTVQAPRRYAGAGGADAHANARLSAQFHAMLCVSRFAHAIKIMGRQMLGGQRPPDEVEQRLQQWLNRYVNAAPARGPESGARQPLREARVQVAERPGQPGVLGCTVQLRPQYQLEDVAMTFRLVTELAPAAQAA